ncbi:MAG TPA: dihydrodipicolinate reductase C-terminal domain-containing protein [Gemmatimonadaceae bacterium]|nr:dihydrodipicolinate reductase C-terminal domain-containing protein [Gemmatimonadaceae bacterium]
MTTRLAIVGVGRMGRTIEQLATERDCQVVARLDVAETSAGITREMLNGADVAVEFTAPSAAAANVRGLVAAGIPTVVGTTGWYDALPGITADVKKRNGALLTATNFSLGVNAFEAILAQAAAILAATGGFDAHMIELHHSAKKDAPSGTAHTLEKAASATWGKQIPITSVRTGSIPGTHEVIFDAPFETIRLAHVARDRRVFAEGAIVAAKWLVGKHGVFTMKDVITSPS